MPNDNWDRLQNPLVNLRAGQAVIENGWVDKLIQVSNWFLSLTPFLP